MAKKEPKIIVIVGGVMSGIGKGAVSASIGKIMQWRGLKVTLTKLDPYIQVDPGTLNPTEHGEVFVTEEVWDFPTSSKNPLRIAELDQDFGTYERFLDRNTHPSQNITSGQIFLTVIDAEREGRFLGQTVQMIPHVTDEIKRRILAVGKEDTDIIIAEIGGTIGDIEGVVYLEAIRQLRLDRGASNVVFVVVTYVPLLETIQELKSKPTQHSVRTLLSAGIVPDFVVCRSPINITRRVRKKISLFGNVPEDSVISNPDLETVYQLPLIFEEQYFAELLLQKLSLKPKNNKATLNSNIREWRNYIDVLTNAKDIVKIAMPGKYAEICDSYISINDALKHAGIQTNTRIEITWLDTEEFEMNSEKLKQLENYDGILVPGGFGSRGVEGKIFCAQFCIQNGIPYLGICYGMQLGLVAFARLLGMEGANTTEVDPDTPYPIIDLLEDQKDVHQKGGTMRLGGYPAKLVSGTRVRELYGDAEQIIERHRHRYEVNPKYVDRLIEGGIIVAGWYDHEEKGKLMEFVELPKEKHPFWLGTQAHPEFKSRPNRPAPLYLGFIQAAMERMQQRKTR
ncbi:MAG: CTP synthase [Candidatus Hermodarchaeota archaeon]